MTIRYAGTITKQQTHYGAAAACNFAPATLTWLASWQAEAFGVLSGSAVSWGVGPSCAQPVASCRRPSTVEECHVTAHRNLQGGMGIYSRQTAGHDAHCNCHSQQLAAARDHCADPRGYAHGFLRKECCSGKSDKSSNRTVSPVSQKIAQACVLKFFSAYCHMFRGKQTKLHGEKLFEMNTHRRITFDRSILRNLLVLAVTAFQ
jgi:hypothetical protein